MKGLQMYWIAATIIGSVSGAAHGYKRQHGGVGAMCKDAMIGGLLYPLMIPVLPLTAFKPSLLYHVCGRK